MAVNTTELLSDITKYVIALKSEKKFPTKKSVKKTVNEYFDKHSSLFATQPVVNVQTDKKTTGFQLMCAHKTHEIQSTAPFVVNKTTMKLVCSYLWGRTSDKISSNTELPKLNLSPLSDEEKSSFTKLARKMNKKFKSTDSKKLSSQKNPYLKMCKDVRPRLTKIEGLENKNFMKIFGYMWTGSFKKNTSADMKALVKKYKLKPLTEAEKKKYM
jgi:hypothetical protein